MNFKKKNERLYFLFLFSLEINGENNLENNKLEQKDPIKSNLENNKLEQKDPIKSNLENEKSEEKDLKKESVEEIKKEEIKVEKNSGAVFLISVFLVVFLGGIFLNSFLKKSSVKKSSGEKENEEEGRKNFNQNSEKWPLPTSKLEVSDFCSCYEDASREKIEEMFDLNKILQNLNKNRDGTYRSAYGIFGEAGIGKTVLAQKLVNDIFAIQKKKNLYEAEILKLKGSVFNVELYKGSDTKKIKNIFKNIADELEENPKKALIVYVDELSSIFENRKHEKSSTDVESFIIEFDHIISKFPGRFSLVCTFNNSEKSNDSAIERRFNTVHLKLKNEFETVLSIIDNGQKEEGEELKAIKDPQIKMEILPFLKKIKPISELVINWFKDQIEKFKERKKKENLIKKKDEKKEEGLLRQLEKIKNGEDLEESENQIKQIFPSKISEGIQNIIREKIEKIKIKEEVKKVYENLGEEKKNKLLLFLKKLKEEIKKNETKSEIKNEIKEIKNEIEGVDQVELIKKIQLILELNSPINTLLPELEYYVERLENKKNEEMAEHKQLLKNITNIFLNSIVFYNQAELFSNNEEKEKEFLKNIDFLEGYENSLFQNKKPSKLKLKDYTDCYEEESKTKINNIFLGDQIINNFETNKDGSYRSMYALYGEPGVGKTVLAKKLTEDIAVIQKFFFKEKKGKNVKTRIVKIMGTDFNIVNYVGNDTGKIESFFKAISNHLEKEKEETLILYADEFSSIFGVRTQDRRAEKTDVEAFLAHFDNLLEKFPSRFSLVCTFNPTDNFDEAIKRRFNMVEIKLKNHQDTLKKVFTNSLEESGALSSHSVEKIKKIGLDYIENNFKDIIKITPSKVNEGIQGLIREREKQEKNLELEKQLQLLSLSSNSKIYNDYSDFQKKLKEIIETGGESSTALKNEEGNEEGNEEERKRQKIRYLINNFLSSLKELNLNKLDGESNNFIKKILEKTEFIKVFLEMEAPIEENIKNTFDFSENLEGEEVLKEKLMLIFSNSVITNQSPQGFNENSDLDNLDNLDN